MQPSAGSSPGLPFVGTELPSEVHGGVRYQIERVLGQGGTAVAYFATRQAPDGQSPVVVKVILPRLVMESGDHAQTIVKKEAVALGRLNERVPPTPFVVRLMDTGSVSFAYFGRSLQLPWIALEYVNGGVEGTTLEDRVGHSVSATRYAFDPTRARHLLDSLSRGLTEIHAVGVVHRDLTPGNVLCCGSGDSEMFKISDFGIARPMGLAATFGDAIVGTPGYIAPEQIGGNAPVGPQSDVFSLAGIVYFVLTGQRYFEVSTPTQALVAAGTPERRSLLDAATLCPELRSREAACQAIDLALARATAPDPAQRPRSAKLFAESLLPWIEDESRSSKPSRRWITSMELFASGDPSVKSAWTMRHPPGDDRLLTSVAWNASGHCLAASTRGLVYWDGVRWAPASTTGLTDPSQIRFVRRLSATRWLVGGDRGLLGEYGDDSLDSSLSQHESVRFTDAHGDPKDMCVVVGEQAEGPPLLHGIVAKRWLRPTVVEDAASISDIARIDDERWLVVGRAVQGKAYAAIYRPLQWTLEPLEVPEGRALLAATSRPERRIAIAVGTKGALLRVERDRVEVQNLEGDPDLASVAIDVLGNEWAAGAGSVWGCRSRRPWKRLWENSTWQAPFISLLAETGMVVAVTVDGGVLESRATVFDPTRPA
ncbi:MAG: serine/threonine protein kinase [Myxococcales bacterium]|nr:serine/threonine protein kinase [Myxococcales bacterium]MCB9576110.1 serine/threonine protein kinase [Polyangiaceae bacterium]